MAYLKARYPRAGQAGSHLVVMQGIETIDASGVNTDMLGHSYIANARNVIEDLAAVLCAGLPPARRQLSPKVHDSGISYWKVK